MSSSNVILIVAVVVAVLLVAAVVAGIALNRRRKISLEKPDESESEQKPGGYQAGGGFSLSSAGAATAAPAEHPVEERTDTEGQPAVGDDASVPRDAERRGIVDVSLPDGDQGTGTATAEPPTAPTQDTPVDTAPPAEAPTGTQAPAEPEQAAGIEAPPEPEAPVEDSTSAASAPAEPTSPPDQAAPDQPAPPVPEAPVAEPVEEIEPTSGRLERLRGHLSRSRSTLGQGLLGLLGAGDLDEDSWEEIEDTLLMADLGAATTTEVVERLRSEIASRGVRTSGEVRGLLREVLVDQLTTESERAVRALPHGDPANGGKPAVVLVVGVNGTGKTTTTGKLARVLIADGRTVLLGAADTFRAAAVEQLGTWGERVGAEVVRGEEAADPASVAFEAVKRGSGTGVDAVLVDTAGRLHTKTGLMDELGKVKRVVEKQAQVDEVLLVLDATTGQNGLTQARVFSDVVDVTGIVLTKLDGTAKGGIVFQVQRELGMPVKLVGLGEGADHLAPFEPEAFVDALLG